MLPKWKHDEKIQISTFSIHKTVKFCGDIDIGVLDKLHHSGIYIEYHMYICMLTNLQIFNLNLKKVEDQNFKTCINKPQLYTCSPDPEGERY